MASSSLVLTARVVEAALRETGDEGSDDRAGENAVNVLLLWPRPGKAEVLGTTGLVRLADKFVASDAADGPRAFAALVLKEVVEGDVALMVHVTDRDHTGAFGRFLRTVASAALGDAAALSGWGSGVLRHAFTEAVERGSMLLAGEEDDRVDVVAIGSEPLLLSAEVLEEMAEAGLPRAFRMAMQAPFDLVRPREKGRLAPGRPNGHLVLELRVERR